MNTLTSDDTPITNDLFSKERSAPVTSAVAHPAVALKGSVFTLPILKLSTFEMPEILAGLKTHLTNAQDFFKHAPVIVDLQDTQAVANNTQFDVLIELLRQFELVCVAVQNGSKAQHEAAIAAGLAVLSGQLKIHPKYPQVPTEQGTDTNTAPVKTESPRPTAPAMKTDIITSESTRVINTPIRSGQRVYAKGGDLILLAAVNAGAEIMADGNIHIYAPLRGRALAGVNGDITARIFCHSLEAELVAVAGSYRVFEDNIPTELYKKSVHIFLDGEQLKIMEIDS